MSNVATHSICIERIQADLEEMAQLFNSDTIGYNRLAFSKEEDGALEWLRKKLEELNVTVAQDAVGNVFGRIGSLNEPAIAMGSHLDTVIHGGLFDGALGVVTGLEILRVIQEKNIQLEFPVELIAFRAEEANPLGGTFGSRSLVGQLNVNAEIEEKLNLVGLTKEDCVSTLHNRHLYKQFIELHIEQGAVLEENQEKIGIATGIAGILRVEAIFKGQARHAGTTPMNQRKDALVHAAKFILHAENTVANYDPQMVVTIGELELQPNLASIVPDFVKLTIEIRAMDWEKMSEFQQALQQYASFNNFDVSFKKTVEKKPNNLDTQIQEQIEKVCIENQIPYRYMMSGANHDCKSMASIVPSALLFIPSKDGISHHPDEFSSWEDIEIGAQVYLETVLQLSKGCI
ncbi:Zn-dependent hydrolase [Lysinibacillus sp. KU-BSD001]|uniref:Zn-dependent hydrolase n=1 Tax=Lysinibacillus sp. KU-BSD001 TaxID=3141328 RepID=UPI0036E223C9